MSRKSEMRRKRRKTILIAASVVMFSLLVYQTMQASIEDPALTALAQCLTDRGIAMYGSDTCPACLQQKGSFAQSFKYIEYIECDKSDACREAQIRVTPTWVYEDQRLEGVQGIGTLAEFSNCTAALETR